MPTASPFMEVCTVIYGRMVRKKLSSSQTTPLKNTTNGQFPLFHPEKYFSTILKVRNQTENCSWLLKTILDYNISVVLIIFYTGRWNSLGSFQNWINYNKIVRDVKYNENTKQFTVRTKDGVKNEMDPEETFDYVVVAAGHYSVPHIPDFVGIDKFPGRVCHAHDFRDASEFEGKRLLLIGSSYSAEDIAMQCVKVCFQNGYKLIHSHNV